jgi:hypothetical protein
MNNKKIIYLLILITSIGAISLSFKASPKLICNQMFVNYPNGPVSNLGVGYTGAAWDNGGKTCSASGCHSNNGGYNTSLSISLLDGSSTAVTQYNPGQTYNFQITVTANSGTPSKFGFNAMAVKSSLHTTIGTWGTAPTGTQKITGNNGIIYLEHSSGRNATGSTPKPHYTVTFPWTAPATGTGSVSFYAGGMATNGASTSGDGIATPVSLTVAEFIPLPLTITNLYAEKSASTIILKWDTESEQNIKNYQIQRSVDGISFSTIGNVQSNSTALQNNYQFIDTKPELGNNFYRLVINEMNGNYTYSKIVESNFISSANFNIKFNPVKDYIQLDGYEGYNYKIINFNGQQILKGIIHSNTIDVSLLNRGNYSLMIMNKNGSTKSCRFTKL